jgi:hypothetical protein
VSVSNQDEYKLPSGETVSIQYDEARCIWEVACWSADGDECRWMKEYKYYGLANTEYERWRK